jgi:hypothetical protein
MYKFWLILFIHFFIYPEIYSQSEHDSHKPASHTAAIGINIPVGEFSETHFAGISLDYSWSKHRFGILKTLPEKVIGFIANGGIDYYFGKKETVAGYEYKYGSYTYLHAFGGIIYNPVKKGNISLMAGPTMGIYKGGSDIGFGVSWQGSYYFTQRIAFTPGILFMKHKEANALWAPFLRASYNF